MIKGIEDVKQKENPRRTRTRNSIRWYPHYHLAPCVGWMNDPNGLVWYDGWYHFFYQHHPFSPRWGTMHWGHARSRDMISWEHLPIALAPSGPDDKDGCFSGSAVVDGNELALIYTGNKYHGVEEKDENLYQVQCLAISQDGVNFSHHGCVLDTPEGIHHFRDPKVWCQDDMWYMVVGAREQEIGQVRLYCSDDLRHWIFEGVLAEAAPEQGYMWECPDMFTLDGKQILMFSPQGIKPKGYEKRNLYQSGYIVGSWSPGSGYIQEKEFRELDQGHDFYAPQSLLTPDGRRVVVGWMGMWESSMPEQEDCWAGMLTLPREITLSAENKILMRPARELFELRNYWYDWGISVLNNEEVCVMDYCDVAELNMTWVLKKSSAEQFGISLGRGVRLLFDAQSNRLILERNYPQYKLVGNRSIQMENVEEINIKVFLDSSSIEVFVNDGESCISSRIYPVERELYVFAWNGEAMLKTCGTWHLN